jgi:hypothetical protein
MLPASRVVQFVPKISVAAVPQEMNEARCGCKTHRNGLFRFNPLLTIQADGAYRFKCACFFLDDGLPLS